MQEYHVSLVSATLGLTLFVAGYGLGALRIDAEIDTLLNRSRADALVATERDALYRSHAHLLIHAIPIHYSPSANSSSNDFWHAFGVPFYYRLCRITGPCNGWRYCLGHIRFQEESIRHYRLGCLRRMCPCDGTHCRRVCRSRERLEMDDMGINVVGWFSPSPFSSFSSPKPLPPTFFIAAPCAFGKPLTTIDLNQCPKSRPRA